MKKELKQSKFYYSLVKTIAGFLARFKFKRKFINNDIKGKKGPFVIICNHAAALDFVTLMGAIKRRINFVISNAFFNTLPFKGIVKRMGFIPKQQFQTNVSNIVKMKKVLDNGGILAFYPAGLMSDDGVSTPIPETTYKFLQWLKADVYVAKNIGTYFSMPKWRKGGIRSGRTYTDITKLFSKEELKDLAVEEVKEKTEKALYFNAYESQEELKIKYKNNANIEGLENVLYMCPNCKKEFTVKVKDGSTIYCAECGFTEIADDYQLLTKLSDVGEEIRYPSTWNKIITDTLKTKILSGEDTLSSTVEIQMIIKNKFQKVGDGTLTLNKEKFTLTGEINGESINKEFLIESFACLPYKPGVYLEVQSGDDIYRCLPTDGRLSVKFVDMVKIFYELKNK
ncbi:MAG: 1-acyl-sn-glycerol-3-phosphate acyltransferase [Clostridia bacterium]|nr:1-acyl-sn-glycerol-3-phosphate acyltransferase [Clostridia bacterium]